MNILDKTFVALDGMDASAIEAFLTTTQGQITSVKIGSELFCAYGKEIVQEIGLKYRMKIFLDLKFHDIPATVTGAVESLQRLPITYLSVHLGGGESMLKEALRAGRRYLPSTSLVGISVLTSLGDSDIQKIWGEKKNAYECLFRLALETGVPAVVLSGQELKLFKELESKQGRRLLKITPGIRFKDEIRQGLTQDQKRVLSPQEAFKRGADRIVMGRSLTKAEDIMTRLRELVQGTDNE